MKYYQIWRKKWTDWISWFEIEKKIKAYCGIRRCHRSDQYILPVCLQWSSDWHISLLSQPESRGELRVPRRSRCRTGRTPTGDCAPQLRFQETTVHPPSILSDEASGVDWTPLKIITRIKGNINYISIDLITEKMIWWMWYLFEIVEERDYLIHFVWLFDRDASSRECYNLAVVGHVRLWITLREGGIGSVPQTPKWHRSMHSWEHSSGLLSIVQGDMRVHCISVQLQ